MKQTTILILLLFLFASVNAQENEKQKRIGEIYCAMLKDNGLMVITKGGVEIMTDLKLNSGTIIRTDGMVVKKDGTEIVLKDGECVDDGGNIVAADKKRKQEIEKEIDRDKNDIK